MTDSSSYKADLRSTETWSLGTHSECRGKVRSTHM